MNLAEIDSRIKSHTHENKLVLDNKILNNVSDFLQEIFSINEILIYDFTYTCEKDSLRLNGFASTPEAGKMSIIIEFVSIGADVAMNFSVEMPSDWQMPLNDTNSLFLSQVKKNYNLVPGEKTVGSLVGCLTLGDSDFNAVGEYEAEQKNWALKLGLKTSQSFNIRKIAADIFKLVNIEVAADIFPDIEISNFIFEYKSSAENRPDEMFFDVTSSASLYITSSLKIEGFGVVVRKLGKLFELTLKGNIQVGRSALPVMMRYRDGGFIFGVDTSSGGHALPNIDDIGSIIGINTSGFFPQEFLKMGGMQLDNLSLQIPSSFNRISTFSTTISTAVNWQFFGISTFTFRDIKFGFDYYSGDTIGSSTSIAIVGRVDIGNFPLSLSAVKSPTDNWIFRGFFPFGEQLSLKELADGFAQAFGLNTIAFPINLTVKDVFVSFGLADKSFDFSAITVVNDSASEDVLGKLFNIEAVVTIKSQTLGNVRTYSGRFEGSLIIASQILKVTYEFNNKIHTNIVTVWWESHCAEQNPLTIRNLVEAFGVKDIPTEVDRLSLDIKKIEMSYDIQHKALHMQLTSETYGEVSVDIDNCNGKVDYQLHIQLKSDIGLSSLPVVGTNLRLLDSLSINNPQLLVCSKDQTVPRAVFGH